jgi:alpha-amylase
MRLRGFALVLGQLTVSLLALPSHTLHATPAPPPALPSWARGATCYEVFVRSFADSDGDGIGDLRGLIQRFDYINDGQATRGTPPSTRSLGARCVWLMPIMESPGYHGYDIADYYRIKREYGTRADFAEFVALAHRRGVRVLMDMVINHVSEQHPFFQAALRDTASPYRALFRWSPARGPDNRWGGNNWHKSPVRDEYYYGFFWQGMPDLNYERPEALTEMKKVATFWLRDMGVDGLRMDAVKFLVEDGPRADDTPGTHAVLREYAEHVRRAKPGAFTIGEVFDNTTSLLSYYPDQLDGYFAFEVADSLIAGVQRGDARGILAPVLRLQAQVPGQRWSPFLRNHDQPRTATELGGDLAGCRLAATVLLTLPGLPFVYYGEELGMTGPKPDERIRTPMPWTLAGPHAGFTSGTPWESLAADSLVANVGAQTADPGSMLSLYRRLIHLRATTPSLASGSLIPLITSNDIVLAYIRRDGARLSLIIANLGHQAVSQLSLSSAAGSLPVGRFLPRDLLPSPAAAKPAALTIPRSGALRDYVPLATLPARSAFLFELR